MDENVGMMTRSRSRQKREAVDLPENVACRSCDFEAADKRRSDRRSFPPDVWTVDESPQAKPQQRSLNVRDVNVTRRGPPQHRSYGACAVSVQDIRCLPDRRPRQQQTASAGVLTVQKSGRKKLQCNAEAVEEMMNLATLHQGAESTLSPAYSAPASPEVIAEAEASDEEEEHSPVPDGVDDIDLWPDSLNSNIYARDVMVYLIGLEPQFLLPRHGLAASPDVTSRMRGVLADWLTQVQCHEELCEETLHLTVAFVDQVLSQGGVMMDRLQLIGITCLLVAAKLTERFAPEISVLCYLTENTFTPSEVKSHETILLEMLDFRLNRPVVTVFLDRYLQVHREEKHVRYLTSYLLDLTLPSAPLVPILPSIKAAAAVYLARFLLLGPSSAWSPGLEFYTGYECTDLLEAVRELAVLLLRAPNSKFQGARNKYNTKEWSYISFHPQVSPDNVMQACFQRDG